LIEEIRRFADECDYLWLFEIDHFRNNYVQEIRKRWKPSRIFLGRNSVMRVALGATVESEYRPGLHTIAALLEGNVGLLFTSDAPHVVTEWFASYTRPDFARTGNLATQTVIMPAGPIVLTDGDQAPHNFESNFRKLGVPTTLQKGIPTLAEPYTVCRKGQKLSPEQINILKLLGSMLATFQLRPRTCLILATGALIHAEDVESTEVAIAS